MSIIKQSKAPLQRGTSQGQLLFWNATGAKWTYAETSEMFWDDPNKWWGLGTATPRQKLDVLDTSNPQLRLTHTDNSVFTDFQTDSSGYLTLTPSGGAITIDGGSTGSPNVLTVLGTKDPTNFFVKNNTAANVSNLAKFSLLLNTDARSRGSFEFRAGFNNIADGSRNTAGEIRVAENGSFKDAMAFDGTLVGFNTTSPHRRIDSLDASNPQLRLTHTDNSIYTDFQTDSSGYLTITPSGGRLGVEIAPTARLHIAEGTATAGTAPLKFTSGTLNTTPEDGTLQYLSNQFYLVNDGITVLSDSKKAMFGAGSDMSIYYNGTSGYIKTDEVAASDLHITTGTAKTVVYDTPVWDDLNFDPDRSGGPVATRPDDVTINNVIHAEYTSANNQFCGSVAELPHKYKLSTDLSPHTHIFLKSGESAGTTGVTFTIYWELRQSTGTTSGSSTMSATSAELTASGANSFLISGTDFTGSAELGGQLALTIARTAGDAGDIVMTTYGVHYQINTPGSRTEEIK